MVVADPQGHMYPEKVEKEFSQRFLEIATGFIETISDTPKLSAERTTSSTPTLDFAETLLQKCQKPVEEEWKKIQLELANTTDQSEKIFLRYLLLQAELKVPTLLNSILRPTFDQLAVQAKGQAEFALSLSEFNASLNNLHLGSHSDASEKSKRESLLKQQRATVNHEHNAIRRLLPAPSLLEKRICTDLGLSGLSTANMHSALADKIVPPEMRLNAEEQTVDYFVSTLKKETQERLKSYQTIRNEPELSEEPIQKEIEQVKPTAPVTLNRNFSYVKQLAIMAMFISLAYIVSTIFDSRKL